MEDASKALIMAGAVLIGVLLLSVLVYLFNNYSQFTYENNKKLEQQQLEQFNAKFEKYENKQLTYHDVLTVSNMAHEYNLKNNNEIEVYIGNQRIDNQEEWRKINNIDSSIANSMYEINSIEKEEGLIKIIKMREI